MTTPEKPAMSLEEDFELCLHQTHVFVHSIIDCGVALQVRNWQVLVGYPKDWPAKERDLISEALRKVELEAGAVICTRDLIRRAQYEARGQRALTKGT